MELIHLPCLLRDMVFGWRIRRGNFHLSARGSVVSAPIFSSKSLSNCDCPGPETLPVAAKTTGRQLSLIAVNCRWQTQLSARNTLIILTTCVRDSALA